MKLKSKYNVGDICKFYNNKTEEIDVGQISKLYLEYGLGANKDEEYLIEPIRMRVTYASEVVRVRRGYIEEKLNKRAFKKAYAERCAKEMMKSE